jgi:hypothetical protein
VADVSQRVNGLKGGDLDLIHTTDGQQITGLRNDAKAGTVKISGDGKDYLAALSYVSNLSRSDSLYRVELVRHEQKANDPSGPVSFAVSAAWSTQ